MFSKHRLLLLFKSKYSALILFAQHSCGTVCFPSPLPALSNPMEPEDFSEEEVARHASVFINEINKLWELDNGILQLEPSFHEQVETPSGVIDVNLASFTLLDPPHKLMEGYDCSLKTLPELRGRPPVEMELLRRAYAKMMES